MRYVLQSRKTVFREISVVTPWQLRQNGVCVAENSILDSVNVRITRSDDYRKIVHCVRNCPRFFPWPDETCL